MVWSLSQTNFQRNIAVVIGINNYQNGIHSLKTAVNDAKAIADLLQKEYKYQEVIRLFPHDDHGEATREKLKELLFDKLPNEIKPTESDRLLFYFAGHGIARNSEDGPAGALIPQDATLGKWETYLPMQDLNTALSKLNCHHLLVVLDCCFAGNFRWSSSRNVIPVPETIHREHYDRFIRCPAWQAITSAAHNQEAIDFLSDLRDGANTSHHSPFALALIEGLKDIKADLTGDGVITAPELYLYLRDHLLSKDGYSELQTPGLWPLQKHDRGEFVFTLPSFKRDDLKPAPPLNEDNNPYRGLQPYDEKHTRFFFGRQELIEEFYKKLSPSDKPSSQLIAVLGISGSGKSSLVKAGLIPYLRKNHEKEWHILEPMRPGQSPFIALAKTILPITKFLSDRDSNNFKKLIRENRDDTKQLIEIVIEWLIDIIKAWGKANPQVKLLLTLDQLEELITMNRKANSANSDTNLDLMKQKQRNLLSQFFSRQSTTKNNNQTEPQNEVQQEWQQFLVLLINTLKNCPQLHIVLTLRSDFEARFVESVLKEYWNQARFPVRPMRSDELREAIEKPASEMALYFEPANAVDRLIDEVGEMPGALPLLSFTLSEFYIKLHQAWSEKRKEDRAVTVDEQFYQQGGIAGSLTHRANEIYDSLPDDAHRDTMRRVMLRMISIEGGEVARRRVPESELMYPNLEENKRKEQIIDSFVNARLLVKGQEGGEAYVEPAHDFFIRGWDKIQVWRNQEQENLALKQLLLPAARDWLNNKKTIGALWDDNPRILLLKQVLESKDNWLNQLETDFVKSSLQRRRNNLRRLVGSITGTILILSGLTIFAFTQQKFATLREKVAIARTLVSTDPSQALALAIQATNQAATTFKPVLSSAESSLFAVLESSRELNVFKGHEGAVTTVAFSPNSQTVVSGGQDGTIRLWNFNGEFKILGKHEGEVTIVAFSPKNIDTLVSGGRDGTVRLWNLKGESKILGRHEGGVTVIAFSPIDNNIFVSSGRDGTLRLWNLNGTSQIIANIKDIKKYSGAVILSLAFSPDGKTIAVGGDGQVLRLWHLDKITTPIEIPLMGTSNIVDNGGIGCITSVAFNSSGNNIIAGLAMQSYPYRETLSVLTSSDSFNSKKPQISLIEAHEFSTYSVAFNPRDDVFVSGGDDGTLQLRNLKGNLVTQPFIGHSRSYAQCADLYANNDYSRYGSVTSLAFSPNGELIASAGADGTVRVWSTASFPGAKLVQAVQVEESNISEKTQVSIYETWKEPLRFYRSDGSSLNLSLKGDTLELQEDENLLTKFKPESEQDRIFYSLNGQMVAIVKAEKMIQVKDVQGKNIYKSFLIQEKIKEIALSTYSNKIAILNDNNQIEVRDFNGNRVGLSFFHEGNADAIAISPDGQTIVTASSVGYPQGGGNSTIRLWDIEGNLITKFYQPGALLNNAGHFASLLAFSPSGKSIISYSYINHLSLQIFPGDWQVLLGIACNRLKRHPILYTPKDDIAKEAKTVCRTYWQ
jgi:WD40 repeat protein